MTLLALTFWYGRAWYLGLVLARIERAAPLHPERLQTERELLESRRQIGRLHRRLSRC